MITIRTIAEKLFGRSGDERRLHHRAMEYWVKRLGDRDILPLEDFDYVDLEDEASHGFLLDLRDASAPLLAYIGPVLRDEAGVDADRIALKDVPESSLIARFAGRYPDALERRAPLTADHDFVTDAGYHVLCRGALLPLSSDGTTLDHIYGVISWKSEKIAA